MNAALTDYTYGKINKLLFVLIALPCLLACFSPSSAAAHGVKRKIRPAPKHLLLSQSSGTRNAYKQLAKRSEDSSKQAPASSQLPVTTSGEANKTKESASEQAEPKTDKIERQQAPAKPSVSRLPAQENPETAEGTSLSADPSLISILADMARLAEDSSNLRKVKDESSRTVLRLAGRILEKSLEKPNLESNRIIGTAGPLEGDKLTCQTWASGEVKAADNLNGSIAAIWAKRSNGLINVTIGGRASDQRIPNGKQIRQFIVVLSGRSSVHKGLDIQSRADVSYWLAELNQITVEADCCSSVTTISAAAAKQLALKKVTLDSSKSVKAELKKDPTPLLSTVVTDQRQGQVESKSQRGDLFRIAADQPECNSSAEHETNLVLRPEAHADKAQIEPGSSTGEDKVAAEGASRIDYNNSPDESNTIGLERLSDSINLAVLPVTPERKPDNSTIQSETIDSARPGLIFPQRAIAGEPLTVSVVNEKEGSGQSQVELSFNGASVRPDEEGKAVYNVPEDATPGKSLKITTPGGFVGDPGVVEVLQPLARSAENQAPHIDSITGLVRAGDLLVISGHNFQGVWRENSVLIDGTKAPVLKASSPMQIKVVVPKDIGPGKHTVTVNCRDANSNAASFEALAIELKACGKQPARSSSNRLQIYVIGTERQVPIHVVNETPDKVVIAKGNDQHLVSPGGEKNRLFLNMQRLKRGAFRIEAKLDENKLN